MLSPSVMLPPEAVLSLNAASKSKPNPLDSSTSTCNTLTLMATWRDNLIFCSLTNFEPFLISVGVAVIVNVPFIGSVTRLEPAPSIDFTAVTIFAHKSMFEMPLVMLPPPEELLTLEVIDGFVGSV